MAFFCNVFDWRARQDDDTGCSIIVKAIVGSDRTVLFLWLNHMR